MTKQYIDDDNDSLIILSYAQSLGVSESFQKQSRRIRVLIEPFTWAWVALKLAEGAVSYVGGQTLASVLGRKEDIAHLINNAVTELKTYIKASLEQQVIDECQSMVNALARDLLSYENAPRSSDHLLNNAEIESGLLMSRLAPIHRAGLGSYVQAVSLRLITLQVRANHFNDKNILRNLVGTVDEGTEFVKAELNAIGAEYDYDTDDVGKVWYREDRGGCYEDSCSPQEYCAFFEDIDGIEHGKCGCTDYQQAIREVTELRAAYIRSLGDQYETTQKYVVAPLNEVLSAWEKTKKTTQDLY